MNEELYNGCLARECEDFILGLQCECTKVMNSLGNTKIKSLELEFARAKLLKLFLEIIYQSITETDNELVRQVNLFRAVYMFVCVKDIDSDYFGIFDAALEFKETNIIADTIKYILSSETLEDIAKKQVVIRELYEQ